MMMPLCLWQYAEYVEKGEALNTVAFHHAL
jgi:hypothetical protein